MKKIRWGIVGPGNIANKFAKAVKNVEGAELIAVASTNEERGIAFAERHGIPNLFVGYEKMAKTDLVDAVYIATPHPFHKPCAEIFLNEGKHVLCEKPVCVNAKDAKELLLCAEKNRVFLMEALWTRFLPAIKEAKMIADSGEIGEIKGVSADFCYSLLPEEEPKIYRNDMAGGSLLDVGVYGLNFAAIFLGSNPEKITAEATLECGVDSHTNILMKYKNGSVAHVSSAINVMKPETAYVYGTKGYISIPNFYGAQEISVFVGGKERRITKNSIGEGFEEEIYEASSCIREGKLQSDVMPMRESITILSQMDCIREKIGLKYPFDI